MSSNWSARSAACGADACTASSSWARLRLARGTWSRSPKTTFSYTEMGSGFGRWKTIPTRRRERTKALIIQPNVLMPEVKINSEETLVSLMQRQDAVINLVGVLHSRDVVLPYSKDFAEAHVELPKKIVAVPSLRERTGKAARRAPAATSRATGPRATARADCTRIWWP